MSELNITMQQLNSQNNYDTLYPKTVSQQVLLNDPDLALQYGLNQNTNLNEFQKQQIIMAGQTIEVLPFNCITPYTSNRSFTIEVPVPVPIKVSDYKVIRLRCVIHDCWATGATTAGTVMGEIHINNTSGFPNLSLNPVSLPEGFHGIVTDLFKEVNATNGSANEWGTKYVLSQQVDSHRVYSGEYTMPDIINKIVFRGNLTSFSDWKSYGIFVTIWGIK